MKFDLTKAKFIPQSNVRTKEISLENLVGIEIKEKIKYDLVYNKINQFWKIDKSFLEKQPSTEGWTASFQDGFVFLIKTNNNQIEELQPKFLKKTSQTFRSDYFTLIMGEVFDLTSEEGFFLNEEDFEGDIKVYSVSTVKTTLNNLLDEKDKQFDEICNSKEGEGIVSDTFKLPIAGLAYCSENVQMIENDCVTVEDSKEFIKSFPVSQVVEEDLY